MKLLTLALAPLLATLTAETPAPAPEPGTLVIRVLGVRNARGRIHIDVCPQDRFLKDGCPYNGSAQAQQGVTTVVVHNMQPGRYAVQAFHDENANGKVDMGFFGKVPKEGVGFSNDAPMSFGPPKFAAAAFSFGDAAAIQLKLRYFL